MARILPLAVVAMTLLAGACGAPSDTFIVPQMSACGGAAEPSTLRVMTYNIKWATLSSLEAIGDVLATENPDIVALQEVDLNAERTGGEDQAGVLAERLGMNYAFAAARTEGTGDFGVALLSKLPFADAQRIELPADDPLETRVALDAGLCSGGRVVRAVTTHIDVLPWAGVQNTAFLAKHVRESVGAGSMVVGDFNAQPGDQQVKNVTDGGFLDSFLPFGNEGTFGNMRIDYVLVDEPFNKVTAGRIIDTDASDHRPLVVDVDIPEGA